MPQETISRAAAYVMLYQLAEPETPPEELVFPDVNEDESAYPALCWAFQTGLLTGYPDGNVRPDHVLTRQEFWVILDRWLQAPETGERASLDRFTDGDQVASWVREAVERLCALGVVNGYPDGSLRAEELVTRREALTILWQLVPSS